MDGVRQALGVLGDGSADDGGGDDIRLGLAWFGLFAKRFSLNSAG
jgi:hypothetical protein